MCLPEERMRVAGAFPTKASSTYTSAPSGVELTRILPFSSATAGGGAGAGAVTGGGSGILFAIVVVAAARMAELCAAQSRLIASHASCTEPPSDKVDLLTIESPLTLAKTATLFLCRRAPFPPS